MVAAKHNFICEQGTDWTRVLTITSSDTGSVRDLSNFTARMKVRPYVESGSVLAELTTENGGIVIDGPTGTITLSLSDEETAAITSDGVYDLEIVTDGGLVERVLKGRFLLEKQVTR